MAAAGLRLPAGSPAPGQRTEDWEAEVAACRAEWDAFIAPAAPAATWSEVVSLEAFRAQVDAVFFGTMHVTKAALPVFRRQGSGYLIQLTSVGGRLTAPGLGAYQSAKFAVEGFSSVLRQEVAPLGIRVTLAEPGAMRTDWAGSSMDIPAFGPGYEATVGAIGRHLRETSGTEPIDPAKVARAFLDLADNPQPLSPPSTLRGTS
jgi:NAD(P)-dependent dehydrogenase (short-subunit alcohol dehydrogenase family)